MLYQSNIFLTFSRYWIDNTLNKFKKNPKEEHHYKSSIQKIKDC